MTPRFSIVMPTRDRAGWIDAAVLSVLDQTFHDWELIIYDNGSDPPRPYADPRIRLFEGPASGAADASNHALERARGEIVTRLNDDDRLPPHALHTVDCMIGDAAWLVAKTKTSDEHGNPLKEFGRPPDPPLTRFGLGGAVYWRRELSERLGGYDPDYETAEDYELFARFARAEPAVFVDEVLYHYTNHARSSSRLQRARQKAAGQRIRAREKAMGSA